MRITKDIYMVGSGSIRLSHKLDCHMYLIDGGNDEFALVDAGGGLDPELVKENIQQEGFQLQNLKYIFLTHSHFDHSAGSKFFKTETGCEVVATELAANLLEFGTDEDFGVESGKRTGRYSEDYSFPHCKVDRIIQDGDTIKLGKYEIQVLCVQGHSKDSACYLMSRGDYKILFTGDTVFCGGGLAPLNNPMSSFADYREQIGKFKDLAIDALLPAHFIWTLQNGQDHLNKAITNLKEAHLPPLWREPLPTLGYL